MNISDKCEEGASNALLTIYQRKDKLGSFSCGMPSLSPPPDPCLADDECGPPPGLGVVGVGLAVQGLDLSPTTSDLALPSITTSNLCSPRAANSS